MEGWSQEIRVRFVWQRGVRFLNTMQLKLHAKYAKYLTSLYLDRLNSMYIDSVGSLPQDTYDTCRFSHNACSNCIHAKYAKYPTSLYLDRLNSIYIDSVTYYCCQLPS